MELLTVAQSAGRIHYFAHVKGGTESLGVTPFGTEQPLHRSNIRSHQYSAVTMVSRWSKRIARRGPNSRIQALSQIRSDPRGRFYQAAVAVFSTNQLHADW